MEGKNDRLQAKVEVVIEVGHIIFVCAMMRLPGPLKWHEGQHTLGNNLTSLLAGHLINPSLHSVLTLSLKCIFSEMDQFK